MNAIEPHVEEGEQARPRRRFWPRTLAGKAGVVALGCFVLLVGMYIAAGHYAAKRLEEAWALSDEFGLPRDFQSLLGPAVAADKNLAVPLDQAAAKAFGFIGGERAKWKGTGDPLDDPPAFAALEGLIKDAEYNAQLAEADARKEYHSPVVEVRPYNSTLMPYLQPRRELALVERAIARRLADQGKREDAVRRLLRMTRVTRRWEDREPFMVAALVNMAIRLFAMEGLNDALRRGGPLPGALHDDIERETAACETILRLVPRMGQFEKIACTGDYEAFSPLGATPLLRPLVDNDRTYMLHYMHRWAKTWDTPLYEARPELEAMEQEIRGIAGDRVRRLMYLGSIFNLPATMQIRFRLDRLIAEARCLRIVNAMARRTDFKAPIDSLGLPKECVVDPFDGKPMRVKQTPKGLVVYSIGLDFKDDGGKVGTGTVVGVDFGFGPPLEAGKK